VPTRWVVYGSKSFMPGSIIVSHTPTFVSPNFGMGFVDKSPSSLSTEHEYGMFDGLIYIGDTVHDLRRRGTDLCVFLVS